MQRPLGAGDPALSGGGWGWGPVVADAAGAVVAGLYDAMGGVAGSGVRGGYRGCRPGAPNAGGERRRGGLGELLAIVRDQADVATTGRRFQTGPVEDADVTPDIADEAALLERPRGEGDATPAHPQQGGQDFMG